MPDYGQIIEMRGVLPSEAVCHRYLCRIVNLDSSVEIWVRAFVYVSISLLMITRGSPV